jgi:hypothetical protein
MRAPALAGVLSLLVPGVVRAAPPSNEVSESPDRGRLEGRVRTAGRRTPLAGAKVLVVPAAADVRPGRPARAPLDPAAVEWIRETRTDEAGEFVLDDLPVGKVRLVVVADGHQRTDIHAEVETGRVEALDLFVEPDDDAGYRTEVISDRGLERVEEAEPDHRLDAEQVRVYPGSGNDPVRAAQNLPGVARSPGGLGMVAIRGGDPRQTGIYIDGHPVPRGFHVLPIASVVSPGMIDSVELTPGNYDAAFGGHSAGLLQIRTRPGPLLGSEDRAIHGEAHVDVFDFGGTISAPVGPGAVTFGARRAHIGNVLGLFGGAGLLAPNYWDYLGRFDMPVAKHHRLTWRALGAGDDLRDVDVYSDYGLRFSAGFHRFDLAHEFARGRWRTSISPAIRLDSSSLSYSSLTSLDRRAWVASLRASASYRLSRRATLVAGLDVVDDHWRRSETEPDAADPTRMTRSTTQTHGRDFALGTWLGVALRFDPRPGPLVLRMQVRLSVFGDGREARAMPDPRADLRFRVHPRVELMAAFGQYSFPFVVQYGKAAGVIEPAAELDVVSGVIDVPIWLITYFDPGIEGEVEKGSLLVGRTLHASTGVRVELPWKLGLRATAFWRDTGGQSRLRFDEAEDSSIAIQQGGFPSSRAYGLELLLERALARDIHGWIGYTLLRSQRFESELGEWRPTEFDQRHNLVALMSFRLPRGFRLGVRFRLVSGNPDQPIYGAVIKEDAGYYEPVRGPLGDTYRPLFHQLDLRLDKTWYAKRASVTGYFDVQNVYNHRYPELWVYTADYRERSERIGLPIFPSLGLRVDW